MQASHLGRPCRRRCLAVRPDQVSLDARALSGHALASDRCTHLDSEPEWGDFDVEPGSVDRRSRDMFQCQVQPEDGAAIGVVRHPPQSVVMPTERSCSLQLFLYERADTKEFLTQVLSGSKAREDRVGVKEMLETLLRALSRLANPGAERRHKPGQSRSRTTLRYRLHRSLGTRRTRKQGGQAARSRVVEAPTAIGGFGVESVAC